jgi:hypothetical protein
LDTNDKIGLQLGELDHIAEEHMAFDEFSKNTLALVENVAKEKGYNETGAAGRNLLFEFIKAMGLGHAEGEIVYKVIRWHAKHDPRDLEKIAGWAYLEWKNAVEGGNNK